MFCVVLVSSQNTITTTFKKKSELKASSLVEIDNHKTIYVIQNDALIKMDGSNQYTYSNIQFGPMSSVDAFNSLKINVFYSDFNSLIILDNRLAEIIKVDFNLIQPFRLASYVSIGNDNTVWLFNQNTQQLELFDYKSRRTRITTLPVNTDVLDLKSNFNFSWLLTEAYCYKYNYFGSLIEKFPNDGYTKIDENNGNIILLKDNQLFYRAKNSTIIEPLNHDELLIKQFLVTDETLYIYDGEFLHHYQLKTN